MDSEYKKIITNKERIEKYYDMKRIGRRAINDSEIKRYTNKFMVEMGIITFFVGILLTMSTLHSTSSPNYSKVSSIFFNNTVTSNFTLLQNQLSANTVTLAQGILWNNSQIKNIFGWLISFLAIVIGLIEIIFGLTKSVSDEKVYDAEEIIKNAIKAKYTEEEYTEFREFYELRNFIHKMENNKVKEW